MNEPQRPRESAKQIAARILRGEKPDPAYISNVNERRANPPCDHYPIMSHGEIVCRDCKAFSVIDMSGQHWVEKAK